MVSMENNRGKILIVDDDAKNAQEMSDLLKREGFSINFALNKSDTLELVSKIVPSLIIIKVIVNDTSGLEIVKKIRSMESLLNTPVVMFVESESDYVLIKKYKSTYGVADVIRVPFDSEDFISRINLLIIPDAPPQDNDLDKTQPALKTEEHTLNKTAPVELSNLKESDSSVKKPEEDITEEAEHESTQEEILHEDEEALKTDIMEAIEADKTQSVPEDIYAEDFNGDIMGAVKKKTRLNFKKVEEIKFIGSIVAVLLIFIAVWIYVTSEKDNIRKDEMEDRRVASVYETEIIREEIFDVPETNRQNFSPDFPTDQTLGAPRIEATKKSQSPNKSKKNNTPVKQKKSPPRAKVVISMEAESKTFSVQTGSFSNRSNADDMINKLKRKGYDAFLKEANYQKSKVFKVLIGKYSSEEKAREIILQLKNRDNTESFLISN